VDLTSEALKDTLSDESDNFDLLMLQALEGTRVDRSRAGEVEDDVDIRVLGNGLLQAGVDEEESLLGSPVEFMDVMVTEGVDHGGNGGVLMSVP
jgi:hypothetical protein